jgi:hypothetical protein
MGDTPEQWRTRGSENVVPEGRIFPVELGQATDYAQTEDAPRVEREILRGDGALKARRS